MWYARVNIPVDVQHILGRKHFIQSTGEHDPGKAYAVAVQWIAEWKARIEEARRSAADPLRAEIARLTADYRQHRGQALDDDAAAIALDAMEFVFQRLGGLSRAEQLAAVAKTRGDVAAALRSIPNAAQAFDEITGRATPFLHHLDAFTAATHLQGKTLHQAISDIRQFGKECKEPLETLSGRDVQAWIETTLKAVSADTVRRKLSAIRGYWGWLQAHEQVSADRNPFGGRRVNSRQTKLEKAAAERARFEPDELVSVWQAAMAHADAMLAAAIRVAAYTGARREGVCNLTIGSVREDRSSKIRYLHFAEKSRSGVRDVPIHSQIRDLIDELIQGADSEGYLIHSSHANKYQKRGDAIGKRFTRLKQEMGFDHRHVFHSIRHTVIHLFRQAECPLEIRNQIVGHADDAVGAGYGGVIGIGQKRHWIEKALVYPMEEGRHPTC